MAQCYPSFPQEADTFFVLEEVNGQLVGVWRKIEYTDLGTGGDGSGNNYLADDMTWKPVSSLGGGNSFFLHPFLVMGG